MTRIAQLVHRYKRPAPDYDAISLRRLHLQAIQQTDLSRCSAPNTGRG